MIDPLTLPPAERAAKMESGSVYISRSSLGFSDEADVWSGDFAEPKPNRRGTFYLCENLQSVHLFKARYAYISAITGITIAKGAVVKVLISAKVI